METRVAEIADGIFQLSTHLEEIDFGVNQYLVRGEEPLLFHTGMRGLFPSVRAAVARVIEVDQLRWVGFGHVEADECGAMNAWLAAAPSATVAHGRLGCMLSVGDLADRPPRPLDDGEVLDVGGHRLRWLDTPHVPHAGADARPELRKAVCRVAAGPGRGRRPAHDEASSRPRRVRRWVHVLNGILFHRSPIGGALVEAGEQRRSGPRATSATPAGARSRTTSGTAATTVVRTPTHRSDRRR